MHNLIVTDAEAHTSYFTWKIRDIPAEGSERVVGFLA